MVKVEHSLKFVTELNEAHPMAQRLLSLPHSEQVKMLEGMLNHFITPKLSPIIDELNAGSSWAILKVVA